MGVAEITPGISGATIAGIFNVYEPFIKVLSIFNPKRFISEFNSFLENLNLPLMIPLMFGMIISIYFSAYFVDYLIKHQLHFFKIFLSLVMIFAVIKNCSMDQSFYNSAKYLVSFAIGITVAILIALSLIQFNFNNNFLLILTGLLAFTAFILPGISGSLVLLILGVYQEIISGVKNFDFLALLPFIIGMLLAFFIVPKLIVKRFKKNEHQTKVLFSGLILGSIPAVWIHLN